MRQPLQAPAVPNSVRVVKGCGWSYTITPDICEGVVPFANLSNPGLFGLEVELLPKYCNVMTCRPVLDFGVERCIDAGSWTILVVPPQPVEDLADPLYVIRPSESVTVLGFHSRVDIGDLN